MKEMSFRPGDFLTRKHGTSADNGRRAGIGGRLRVAFVYDPRRRVGGLRINAAGAPARRLSFTSLFVLL